MQYFVVSSSPPLIEGRTGEQARLLDLRRLASVVLGDTDLVEVELFGLVYFGLDAGNAAILGYFVLLEFEERDAQFLACVLDGVFLLGDAALIVLAATNRVFGIGP